MQRALSEVIVSSAGPSSAGSGSGTVTLYDLTTGSTLLTLKQNFSAPHATAATETRDGLGGLVFSAQLDKGLMNVYSYQKDQLHLRIVLPEKLSCVAVDKDAQWCAAGTANGRIYLWEIASGIMFNSWEAHYRRVSVLSFTPDGGALVTGSEDSTVAVWAMAALLDSSLANEIPNAYYTHTDHTLAITDIVCGIGAFPRCRVLVSSLDNTCTIIDLASKTLLSAFQFPHPITSIIMDPTERVFFAASSQAGQIHQVNLYRPRIEKGPRRSGRGDVEAVGGGGQAGIEMIGMGMAGMGMGMGDGAEEEAGKKRIISVGQPINCMTLSLTSSSLLVGTSPSPSSPTSSSSSSSSPSPAKIHIYDLKSHQLIRSIPLSSKDHVVHSLQTMLKPPDLMGHSTLGLAKNERDGGGGGGVPVRSVGAFARTRDGKMREVHEVPMLLKAASKTYLSLSYPSSSEFTDDYHFFTSPSPSLSLSTSSSPSPNSTIAGAGPAASARISSLERELSTVRAQLARAKALNTSLYETALGSILGPGVGAGGDKKATGGGGGVPESSGENDKMVVDDGRPSKRGRAD